MKVKKVFLAVICIISVILMVSVIGIGCKASEEGKAMTSRGSSAPSEGEVEPGVEEAEEAEEEEEAIETVEAEDRIVLREEVSISFDDLNKELVNPGFLTVAANGILPPNEIIDINNNILGGYNGFMLTEAAERLGLKIKIVEIDFAGIIPALQTGKIDTASMGMWCTIDRAKEVDFCIPHLFEPDTITQPLDSFYTHPTQLKGKTVATSDGNYMIPIYESLGAEVRVFKDNLTAYIDCAQGNSDAADAGTISFSYMKSINPELEVLKGLPVDGEPGAVLGWPIKKGNDVLRTALNLIMEDFWRTGFNYEVLDDMGIADPLYFSPAGIKPYMTKETHEYLHSIYFYNEDGTMYYPLKPEE